MSFCNILLLRSYTKDTVLLCGILSFCRDSVTITRRWVKGALAILAEQDNICIGGKRDMSPLFTLLSQDR